MQPRDDDADAVETRVAVAGHQVDVGEALRAHAIAQLLAVASKYFGGAEDIAATFSRTGGGGFGCSIRIHAGRDLFFDGEAEGGDAHVAFDQALARVAKQLRRRKRSLREDKPANPTKEGLP
jgi:ribosomal subunit interface protein